MRYFLHVTQVEMAVEVKSVLNHAANPGATGLPCGGVEVAEKTEERGLLDNERIQIAPAVNVELGGLHDGPAALRTDACHAENQSLPFCCRPFSSPLISNGEGARFAVWWGRKTNDAAMLCVEAERRSKRPHGPRHF